MSCNCCLFIQPDTAISRNRNGSRDFVMRKVTLSSAIHGPVGNPLQIYADRFSGHYEIGSRLQAAQAIYAAVVADGAGYEQRRLRVAVGGHPMPFKANVVFIQHCARYGSITR